MQNHPHIECEDAHAPYFNEPALDFLEAELDALNRTFRNSPAWNEGYGDAPFSLYLHDYSFQIHFDGRQILASGIEFRHDGNDAERIADSVYAVLRAVRLTFSAMSAD